MSECMHGVNAHEANCPLCCPESAPSEMTPTVQMVAAGDVKRVPPLVNELGQPLFGETPRTDHQAYRATTQIWRPVWNDVVSADFARTLERELAEAKRDAERYLDAIFQMADDGWLMHGVEGMSDVQEAVYKITQEHPTYKARVEAARKEGQ